MAIENPNSTHAIALCEGDPGAGGPAFLSNRGFLAIIRNGIGDYTLTMEQGLNLDSAQIAITSQGLAVTWATDPVQPDTPTNQQFRIRGQDLVQGLPLDSRFSIRVMNISPDVA